MAEIEVKGLEPLLAKLGKMDNLISQLAEPTKEMLTHLRERLQQYPPAPAGSTYVRTYTLKNSWQETVILAGDRLGMMSNPTSYGPFVMSQSEQAEVHRGRWQTVEDVASQEEEAVIAFYEDYIQELLNG